MDELVAFAELVELDLAGMLVLDLLTWRSTRGVRVQMVAPGDDCLRVRFFDSENWLELAGLTLDPRPEWMVPGCRIVVASFLPGQGLSR
jgi:hypothetical protein